MMQTFFKEHFVYLNFLIKLTVPKGNNKTVFFKGNFCSTWSVSFLIACDIKEFHSLCFAMQKVLTLRRCQKQTFIVFMFTA